MDTKTARNLTNQFVGCCTEPILIQGDSPSSDKHWFGMASQPQSLNSIENIAIGDHWSKQFRSADNSSIKNNTSGLLKYNMHNGSKTSIFNKDSGIGKNPFSIWNEASSDSRSGGARIQEEKQFSSLPGKLTYENSQASMNLQKSGSFQYQEISYFLPLDEESKREIIPYVSRGVLNDLIGRHIDHSNSIIYNTNINSQYEHRNINEQLSGEQEAAPIRTCREPASTRNWKWSEDPELKLLGKASNFPYEQNVQGQSQGNSKKLVSSSIQPYSADDKLKSAINTKMFNKIGFKAKLIVVDCRYHYEYDHGHIKSAINISSPAAIQYLFGEAREYMFRERFIDSLLGMEGRRINVEELRRLVQEFDKEDANKPGLAQIESWYSSHEPVSLCERDDGFMLEEKLPQTALDEKSIDRNSTCSDIRSDKTYEKVSTEGPTGPRDCIPVLVFHCEFSKERGPDMWRLVRRQDRQMSNSYPSLDFEQSYVLRDGFEKFVEDHGEECVPQHSYMTMDCESHHKERTTELRRMATEWKIVKKPT